MRTTLALESIRAGSRHAVHTVQFEWPDDTCSWHAVRWEVMESSDGPRLVATHTDITDTASTSFAGLFTASFGKDGVDLCVSDTGCGIPEAMMAKIFEPFQRADSMVTRTVEGSGLGLAISRQFMLMHGGELILESRDRKSTRLNSSHRT